MARPVKCPICNSYFNRDEEEHKYYKNRYYHKRCFDKFWEEESARQALIDYILKLFKLKSPGPKIYNQLNKYTTTDNFTYRGILNALKYFFEIKGNDTSKANGGIGIVPHVYEQAQIHFHNKATREQRIKNNAAQYKRTADLEGTHIVIEKTKITGRKKNKKKLIDIDEL